MSDQTEATYAAIAKANDEARKFLFNPDYVTIVLARALGELPREQLSDICDIIQNYENWTSGDDPYGERDFGVIYKRNDVWTQEPQGDNFKGKTVYFKFTYYSKTDPDYGSEHPEDTTKTKRVLTIMFAEDY